MFSRISNRERVFFTKNLAVMLKSGITINEALAILADQTKSRFFKKTILGIRTDVESGSSLSEAFAKYESLFGPVFISLLRAGESSGTLDEDLAFLSDWLERNNDLRDDIRAATLYPKFVFFATFVLGAWLSLYILPKLLPFFAQLRVQLPLSTRLLLGFTLFLQTHWKILSIAIIGGSIAAYFINRIPSVRRIMHNFYLHIPVFGALTRDYQLSLVAQLFYTLSKSGMPLIETLDIVAGAATNLAYQDSLRDAKRRVQGGTPLASAISNYPAMYPKNFLNIVATGEKSGTIDDSFFYLSEYYVKEVKNKTKKIPTSIEPIMLVCIAIVIGFVAISIIMPIYQLTSGLTQ